MILVGLEMNRYNNLAKYSIHSYIQLENLFFKDFRINIKYKTSIKDLTKL